MKHQVQQPAFIDFEASSLDLVASFPVEVGICLADGSVHSWLIRPVPNWIDWSDESEGIHGISREQLMDEGIHPRQVAHHLNELVAHQELYCDAWAFDSFWLHRLYKAAKDRPSFHLEEIAALLNVQQISRWADARLETVERLGLQTHRAANDARILYETWQGLCRQ